MIDIHSHIIYNVDDGADTLEESLQILAESMQQGTRIIVATPHIRKHMFETDWDVIRKRFEALRKRSRELFPDLRLLLGCEVYYTPDVREKLDEGRIPSFASTDYILVEFGHDTSYGEIHRAVRNIFMSGKKPILAHIERYDALAFDNTRCEELIDMGCVMQVNAGSLLKPRWWQDPMSTLKKRARFLMKENMVHCVASDVHHMETRKNHMRAAAEYVEQKYGQERVRELFSENPRRILHNERI